MRILAKVGVGLAVLLAVALVLVFTWLPGRIDRSLNLAPPGPYPASERAQSLVARSVVIDLHADPFLWSRDLLARNDHGQVDLPRLIEGHVAIQTFGVATKTPAGLNFERNESDAPDMMTALVVTQRWPLRTWTSLFERALHQADRLHDAAERSEGALRVLRTRDDLDQLLAQRAGGEPVVGSLLGLEGLHALEGDLAKVDVLFDAGFRMLGLAHFFDNEAAGSSAGVEKHGLTELGRRVVEHAEAIGMTVDLAHGASASLRDVLAMATRPVVVSHTGVQATCPGPRNLTDEEVVAIGENGGVVGVGYFAGAVCDPTPAGIVRAMRHVRNLVGVDHVGLGSDFDGSVATAFDTTGIPLLVDALFEDGWSEAEVTQVLGTNALRVLSATLPE